MVKQIMKRTNSRGFGLIGVFVVIVVLALVGGSGWYVYKHHQSKAAPKPLISTSQNQSKVNTPPAKHGSTIVGLDDTYNQYINYNLGISLTYSKNVASPPTCQNNSPDYNNPVATPVSVYDDSANNRIYVAASTYATTVSHEIRPGSFQGYDSCTMSNTRLNDVVNANVEQTLPTIKHVLAVEFDYATIANSSDLDAFVAPRVPTGIVIDHSTPPSDNGGVYTYTFKYTGNAPASPTEPRWYSLIYDPMKKLAVFWVTPNTQSPSWQGVNSAGQYTEINTPSANILQ